MRVEFIDASGLPCPLPVVQAKKALEQHSVGCVKIKVDNFTAVQNLEKMAAGLGFVFEFNKVSDSEFDAVLSKNVGKNGYNSHDDSDSNGVSSKDSSEQMVRDVVPVFREPESASGDVSFVVAIGSDAMGRGSDELGKVLMKSFIYSLTELDTLPEALLFFNSGALLTNADSSATRDLLSLANTGVRVLTCGACVDYYKLPPPAVGDITNMYEIAGIMAKADRLISL